MKNIKVSFNNTQGISLSQRNNLKQFLQNLSKKEGREIDELVYVFCSKKEIIEINKKFLSHNYPTDIITFDLSTSKKDKIVADIYICPEIVKNNAKDYHQTQKSEMHRVIFHGLLHLCGYDDKSIQKQKKMREKENEYLNKYFVSRGTKD